MTTPHDSPSEPTVALRRRQFLALAAGSPLLGLAACGNSRAPAGAGNHPAEQPPTQPRHFLTAEEHRALEALVERLIPTDTDPGAKAAGCAEAICYLLGAFLSTPAFIYAGGPFSDRNGSARNDFSRFVPLDEYEALGWRITIEGSLGLPEREFNGPVRGWQAIYREGLAQLDTLARGQGAADFAALSAAQQDALLNQGDTAVNEMLDIAFPQTLTAMYGAPEYGGNQNLAGWGFTAYDGDVHPKGYTDDQVVNPDNPQPTDALLPPSFHDPAQRDTPIALRLQRALFPTPTQASQPLGDNAVLLAYAAPSETLAGQIQAAEGRLSLLKAQFHIQRTEV